MANARWNQGLWDQGRWGSLTIEELLAQAPPTSGGFPTGQGDWRLIVEILLPTADSGFWGIGLWNASEWAYLAWDDISDQVRGMEWVRGSDEIYGRPRVGRIRLSVDDQDGSLDPWAAPAAQYLAPGTILRAGIVSPSGIVDTDYGTVRWLPQWTGIVESWTPQISSADAADRWVEISLAETTRDLSQIEEPALSSPVGSGEGADSRVQRLLTAAGWRYGYLLEAQNLVTAPTTSYPLQSTVMTQNRISETYVSADSSDTVFRSLRDGRGSLTSSEYFGDVGNVDREAFPLVLTSWDTQGLGRSPLLLLDVGDGTTTGIGFDHVTVAYRPETFRSQAQDLEIANSVTIQRVGGTAQTFTQVASVNRFGLRTYQRNDYLNTTDTIPLQLAEAISIRQALTTLRLDAVTIDTWARPLSQFLAVVSTEPTDPARVTSPLGADPRPYLDGFVASILHRVSPRVPGSSVIWETEIRVDTRTITGVPGADLPAT